MSPFRPSRERRGPDPYVVPKMVLFVTGAALAFAGIGSGRQWLVYLGIAVLLVGVLLRLATSRRQQR